MTEPLAPTKEKFCAYCGKFKDPAVFVLRKGTKPRCRTCDEAAAKNARRLLNKKTKRAT